VTITSFINTLVSKKFTAKVELVLVTNQRAIDLFVNRKPFNNSTVIKDQGYS